MKANLARFMLFLSAVASMALTVTAGTRWYWRWSSTPDTWCSASSSSCLPSPARPSSSRPASAGT